MFRCTASSSAKFAANEDHLLFASNLVREDSLLMNVYPKGNSSWQEGSLLLVTRERVAQAGGGGAEKGLPGLAAGIVFMGVKAESLSNKACASRPNLRITTTLQRIFLLIENSQSADSASHCSSNSAGRLTGAPLPLSFSAFFFLPCGRVTLHASHRHSEGMLGILVLCSP